MRYLFLILFSIVLFTACQKSESPQNVSANAKRYPLSGKVVAVDKAKKKATVAHKEIPGYMEAMTMDFPVRSEDALNTMSKDSEITGELVVDNANGKYWLEISSVTSPPNSADTSRTIKGNAVETGKEVPDFKLTNQDGKRISLRDFRGRALAITFIYSRCPLPDYCILMSKNFSDLANRLQNSPELKDKIRLLSISFDPETDTPEVLKKYGLGYLGKDAKPDFTIWQLATGTEKEVKDVADFFGLMYQTDEKNKAEFIHSLQTIVIAPDGKVQKVFTGNEWTTNELLQELQSTLK
jgi:protein SCO1